MSSKDTTEFDIRIAKNIAEGYKTRNKRRKEKGGIPLDREACMDDFRVSVRKQPIVDLITLLIVGLIVIVFSVIEGILYGEFMYAAVSVIIGLIIAIAVVVPLTFSKKSYTKTVQRILQKCDAEGIDIFKFSGVEY